MQTVGHSELALQPASRREDMQDRLGGSTHTAVAAGSVAGNVAGEVDTTAVDGIEVAGVHMEVVGCNKSSVDLVVHGADTHSAVTEICSGSGVTDVRSVAKDAYSGLGVWDDWSCSVVVHLDSARRCDFGLREDAVAETT